LADIRSSWGWRAAGSLGSSRGSSRLLLRYPGVAALPYRRDLRPL